MTKELRDLTRRSEDYGQWCNDLITKADLAGQSAARGCMTIKPHGYAVWEKTQQQLDEMFKEAGTQNAYFPLLIPRPFLSREAEHMKEFAKKCAVVAHYRFKSSEIGNSMEMDPAVKPGEELIVRPISGTIIRDIYKN